MLRRGVRYHRAIPPPRDEWEPDYGAIANAGLDFVVVCAPWSLAHVGQESFDFSPLLEQLDLADRRGLGLVVAVNLTTAPPWLLARHPEYLHEDAAGLKARPRVTADAPCGGWPGLCFDNGAVRAYAGRFLRALAAAVAERPALAAYDLTDHWALEELLEDDVRDLWCQCAGSRARFVAWLRRAYGEDLATLGRAWERRLTDWAEAAPPGAYAPSPDALDWLRFQRDTLAAHVRWCVEALREADPRTPTVAAGVPPASEHRAAGALVAQEVSEWGCTARHLLPHEAADCLHGLAPGKKLWLTELSTKDKAVVRRDLWSLRGAGVGTVVYDAWRHDRGATTTTRRGLARPDGTPSPRLDEVHWFAGLAARHPELADAQPSPPEVAIVVVPESQLLWRLSELRASAYEDAVRGAYEAFTGRGTRTVLAPPDGLEDVPLAYVPMAQCMTAASAEALRRYVERGGRLVAEACLARSDPHGIAGRVSPGCSLDEVFGARAVDAAEQIPGEGRKPTFKGRRGSYPCFCRREPLEATTGSVKATFDDGTAAIVDHTLGQGATRLIGTVPSFGCARGSDPRYARVILDSLAFARVRPRLRISSPGVCARLLEGDGVWFLCVFNPTDATHQATVTVSRAVGTFRATTDLATGRTRRLLNNARRVKLPPAEGILLRLETVPPRRWRRERGQ